MENFSEMKADHGVVVRKHDTHQSRIKSKGSLTFTDNNINFMNNVEIWAKSTNIKIFSKMEIHRFLPHFLEK